MSIGLPGTYSVSLAVAGPNGSDAGVRTGYVHVAPPHMEVFPGKSLVPTDPDGTACTRT